MGNSASALPYSIDNQVGAPHDHHGWALHNGKSTDAGAQEVSVFVGKKPSLAKTPVSPRFSQQMQLIPAIHHYNHSRKLRHPHILKVFATLDTDNPTAATTEGGIANASQADAAAKTTGDLIIVTEPCVSLTQWLLSHPSPEQLAWGLECLIRGLWFLHNDAKLAHGNLSPTSFYVTRSGDVKLWNFSLVTPVGVEGVGPTPHFQEWEMACTPDAYRSPERVERRWDAISTAGVHGMDSYGLGILMDHWFNGQIPAPLQKAVQRLQTPNLKMRPRLQPLLKCPVFDTPYQKLQLQLEEMAIQPVEQKIRLWQDFGTLLQHGKGIPADVALYKVLPLLLTNILSICTNENMLTQDLYRREVLSMLQPLFYIVENYLDADKIGTQLGPLVALLFKVKDRGVRGVLLGKVEFMSQHLSKNTLNANVFEPLCSGFNDSSPPLREMTLKATYGLVPYLNAPNVEKLSRYLVRLQSDTETAIRANAVIFISKIAPQMSEVAMQKMLLPAYSRAFKDPFAPCRLAALQATVKSKDLFTLSERASKVLPAVMPLLLDPMPNVRAEAFQVVHQCLAELQQESDRMAITQAQQQQQQQQAVQQQQQQQQPKSAPSSSGRGGGGAAVAPAPKSGSGYMSGLSSWMSSSTKPEFAEISKTTAPMPVAAAPMTPLAPPVQQFAATSLAAPPVPAADDGWGDEDNDDDDGGWGDEDDDDDNNDLAMSNIGKGGGNTSRMTTPAGKSSLSTFSTPNQYSVMEDDDDDPFASIGMKTTLVAPRGGGSATRGKLVMPKKTAAAPLIAKAKPATKLTMDDSGMGDGWDDF